MEKHIFLISAVLQNIYNKNIKELILFNNFIPHQIASSLLIAALGLKPLGAALFGLKCWGKLQIQALNWWSTPGFSYDDDTEELTRFANKVVRSQEDFTRWKTKTHKRLDRLILSVFFLIFPLVNWHIWKVGSFLTSWMKCILSSTDRILVLTLIQYRQSHVPHL